jgi:hypothetical protein
MDQSSVIRIASLSLLALSCALSDPLYADEHRIDEICRARHADDDTAQVICGLELARARLDLANYLSDHNINDIGNAYSARNKYAVVFVECNLKFPILDTFEYDKAME